ncbi:hypothetical protein LP419_06600 [Massilia sp. H-1]|nr:hypothetical protein LP419_06600 [Massilia sp. H-1]
MITVFHKDFFSYTLSRQSVPCSSAESIDGTLSFEAHNGINRVKTAQEAKGHGLKAWPFIGNFTGASNQDGVVYYPTLGAPEYPTSGNDRYVPYRLVDMLAPNGMYAAALSDAIQPSQPGADLCQLGHIPRQYQRRLRLGPENLRHQFRQRAVGLGRRQRWRDLSRRVRARPRAPVRDLLYWPGQFQPAVREQSLPG